MSMILPKHAMTEEDIKLQYITPALTSKWPVGKITMETQITDGKINLKGNFVLVLAKENNRLLLLSLYALDSQPYNEKDTWVTWETCTLRKWLNNDFLNEAFSDAERSMIPTVTVSADKNPVYSTSPGNATQDMVFLLSISEVNKYFTSDSTRVCNPTAYATQQGAKTNDSGSCWWWLRSPGSDRRHAADVSYYGHANDNGNYLYWDFGAIRPALWVQFDP